MATRTHPGGPGIGTRGATVRRARSLLAAGVLLGGIGPLALGVGGWQQTLGAVPVTPTITGITPAKDPRPAARRSPSTATASEPPRPSTSRQHGP